MDALPLFRVAFGFKWRGFGFYSFFKDSQKIPEKRIIVKQKVKPPQQVPKVAPQSPIKEEPKIVEKVNEGGIPCPHCKKVFSRALVMLDFRGRKHTLVSVCPLL